MSDLLEVSIPGDPVGKGRPRVANVGGFARAYTPAKTRNWETGAAMLMRERWDGAPLDEPVAVLVRAIASRPQRLRRAKDPQGRIWRTTKPDGDNVLKAALDSLVAAGVVIDDTRVVTAKVDSLYAATDEGPAVEVLLWRVGEYTGA